MAKMVFHFDDGSVIETGPKRGVSSPENAMKNHTRQMENLLREVERTGGRVPDELVARVHYLKKEWG